MQYVSDYLRLVGGVFVNPDGTVSIRSGVRVGYGLPLVFIDGIEQYWPERMQHVSQSPIDQVPVSMIESIDVFKGFGAAIFGMRGANGAISITTKRGEGMPPTNKSYHVVYTPLGYQKPVEFYSPKYETQEAKWSAIPDYRTTIFWKPDLVISYDEEEASFEFYTSDFKTTYSVVIEGLTVDGKIIRQVEKIRVE
jgi:TonB-dependent SusC/RagA subfamily outer membrane receptor